MTKKKDKAEKEYTTEVFPLTALELESTHQFHRNRKNKIAFIGHILYNHGLFSLQKGRCGQLCQPSIARGLGLSTSMIGKYIKLLVGLKWLSVDQAIYQVGVRSKGYVCITPVLREIYVSRFPTESSKNGLKKSYLVEKRITAWKDNKPAIMRFNRFLFKCERFDVEVTRSTESALEAEKAFMNIAKLYLGNYLDLLRDIDGFEEANGIAYHNHRRGFYFALKSIHTKLDIKKEFTKDDFLGPSKSYIRMNYLFCAPVKSRRRKTRVRQHPNAASLNQDSTSSQQASLPRHEFLQAVRPSLT
jgi:hypothetical protein